MAPGERDWLAATRAWMLAWVCAVIGSVAFADAERLELHHQSIMLPAAPAAILSADVNYDGMRDLTVALAYTEWDQIGFEESSQMEDVDGLVMVMTVIPALMDRRELRVFLGDERGEYSDAIAPLELDMSVLSLDLGTERWPIIALTDEGVTGLVVDEDSATLEIRPVVESIPVLAHSATLLPNLGFSRDLDGDDRRDLILPVDRGLEIHVALDDGSYRRVEALVELPGGYTVADDGVVRVYPLPTLRDIDSDGDLDILVPSRTAAWHDFHLLEALGGGRFAAPRRLRGRGGIDRSSAAESEAGSEFNVHFGDIDGDGVVEYLTEESLADDDTGWRKELKEAKRPPRRYRVYESASDLTRLAEPSTFFEATGYAFDLEDADIRLPSGFLDLDGNGRQDLVTMTLEFSLLQALRILATQRIGIGLDFSIWCQESDGTFAAVPDLDLSGKFRLNLKDLQLGQLSQFAGDFDGDGRLDFVQMGRGKIVTIHRGSEGCRYPAEPDLRIKLQQAPVDLSLVQVRDFDGDGLADLLIVQPQSEAEAGVTAPVRLDLYLSGGRS